MALTPMNFDDGYERLLIDISKSNVSLTANTGTLVDFTTEINALLTDNPDYEYETIFFNGMYGNGTGMYCGRGISTGTNAKKCSVTSSVTYSSFYVYAIVSLKHK